MNLYFTDYFGVSEDSIEEYGAFNISLVTDLPLASVRSNRIGLDFVRLAIQDGD
jgi:hypothetical protein